MIATGLVDLGARVTIFCAAHAAAPPDETVDGIRYVRRGGRSGSTCAACSPCCAARSGGRRRGRRAERPAVLDPLVTSTPVVVLVHHVHREQWPVVCAGPPGQGRLVDRAAARAAAVPHCQYVAVSQATRAELRDARGRRAPDRRRAQRRRPAPPGARPARPTSPTLRRRRPAGAAQAGRARDRRRARAARASSRACTCTSSGAAGGRATSTSTSRTAGAGDTVAFEGHVDEQRKHEIYERVVAAAAALDQGGLGPGDRRGRHARDARPSPTARRAAPRSRSPTRRRACWSTTPPAWSRRPAGC